MIIRRQSDLELWQSAYSGPIYRRFRLNVAGRSDL